MQDLVAIGDPAVAPLLEVLESDNRLTRSVTHDLHSFHDSTSPECFVHPVHEPAFAALIGILRTGQFNAWPTRAWRKIDPAGRKEIASEMRQFWGKNRSVAVVDRWYQTLLDDSAGPDGWREAAEGLTQPVVTTREPAPSPGTRAMQGEALGPDRRRNVTALLLRRPARWRGRAMHRHRIVLDSAMPVRWV